MKATGIVRRIDELGRVVIPKEIRRTLRIREGDPLEIFTDREGEVILKKYSPIGELGDFAKEYAESLQLALGMTAAVCDKDTVIAASGPCRKELMDKPIHSDLEELMDRRGRLCVGADGGTAPHILAMSLPGYPSGNIVSDLGSRGICISAGSACHKGKSSHVVSALGLDKRTAAGVIRISFAPETTEDDIQALYEALQAHRAERCGML